MARGLDIAELFTEISSSSFQCHVYNTHQQYCELKYLKNQLKIDEIVCSVDFLKIMTTSKTRKYKAHILAMRLLHYSLQSVISRLWNQTKML